ncbi:unnamed protein product [Trichogramma brassicae]|uniref:Uncharacterized protein n=1 Tax=Trichogramma brassicae TaxID=86971 RepID=A0A6H5IBR1_9HYME|nr:unnamed protein product [Trichogramma brassicae]
MKEKKKLQHDDNLGSSMTSTMIDRSVNAYIRRLETIVNAEKRRAQFCNNIKYQYPWPWELFNVQDQIMKMMKNESLFPTVGNEIYFMKYAFEHEILLILKALHANGEHIHEFRWEDGKSALHYLVEQGEPYSRRVMSLINFLLKNSEKNYCDERGYSYLHGACFAGDIETVERFVRQGVDVNLDTYTRSALHIAAQYHHKEIVKILLDHGADPNQLDHEQQSTPLHALAWPVACIFVIPTLYFYSSRKPVDDIVDMLVMKKANIEARNSHGDSPLQYAVSRFNVDVAGALLKNSASLSSLNEDRIFSTTFTTLELKSYSLTFHIIEMMKLLKSADYQMNMNTRLRMLKYWMEIRGNDTDHLIPYNEGTCEISSFRMSIHNLLMYNEYGFYIKPESMNYLRLFRETSREKMANRIQRTLVYIRPGAQRVLVADGGLILKPHASSLFGAATTMTDDSADCNTTTTATSPSMLLLQLLLLLIRRSSRAAAAPLRCYRSTTITTTRMRRRIRCRCRRRSTTPYSACSEYFHDDGVQLLRVCIIVSSVYKITLGEETTTMIRSTTHCLYLYESFVHV